MIPTRQFIRLAIAAIIALVGWWMAAAAGSITETAAHRSAVSSQEQDGPTGIQRIGKIQDKRILECSGMAPSTKNPNAFWVHNDSGAAAELFLINHNGKTIMKVELEGVNHVDFEDIALAEPPDMERQAFLIIADIGDNRKRRDSLVLHVIGEPEFSGTTTMAIRPRVTIQLNFDDGRKHNCEGLAYDPIENQFVIATKLTSKEILSKQRAQLFTIAADFKTKRQAVTAKSMGKIPGGMITGLDISRDGKQIVAQNYLAAFYWGRVGSLEDSLLEQMKTVPLPLQRQSESICFSSDGKTMLTTSEGKFPPIYEIDVPAESSKH